MTDFYDFLENLIFRILWWLRISSAAHNQIIVCVLFYVNMFDQIHLGQPIF